MTEENKELTKEEKTAKAEEYKEKLRALSDEELDGVAGGDMDLPDYITGGLDGVLPGREEIEGLLLNENMCYKKSNPNC